jgi:hypothetical protein
MNFVFVWTNVLDAAARDVAGIRSALSEASMAATSTTQLLPAGTDEVSVAIAKLFGTYGQQFQALSLAAGQFHSSFVQALSSGGIRYAAAEAAATAQMAAITDVGAAPFSPFLLLFGRAAFGNGVSGANGAAGTGANGGNGGAGGFIWGNGGNGGSGG